MALGSYNTFASARLDRPDQSLRRIAIKQMSGQQLNASEIDRLARRQGVEGRYEQFGNPNFSSGSNGMDSAYARAGAPFGIRSRLMSEGSTLGRLSAEYGGDNIGGVQQLARERLLRERELGNLAVDNARWNAARRQEDYDWAQELRERQRKNWETADRRLADEESGRNAIMEAERPQQQIDNTPSSLLDRRYSKSPYAGIDDRMNVALQNNDFGAYSALYARRNAMVENARKAQAEAVREQAAMTRAQSAMVGEQNNMKLPKHEEIANAYEFYTKRINEARARGDNEAADFYATARANLVAQKSNAGKSDGEKKSLAEDMKDLGAQPKPTPGAAGVSTAAGGEKKPVAGKPEYTSPTAGDKPWYEL